ncbi:MAG: iron ABC transporter permease [Lachnospiraceae bacterium]
MTKKKVRRRIWCLVVLFVLTILISLSLGRYWIHPVTIVKVVLSKILPIPVTWETQVETVLFQVRFPRMLLGILVGSGLSLAGATYQGIFQNPMVSPDILGASWGAGFGAALGLFASFSYVGVSLSAFAFGLLAVFIVCVIGRFVKNNPTLGFILAGIMVGTIFSSGVSYLKLVADPLNTLPAITYWLMGSLASAKGVDVGFAGPLIVAGMIPIILLRWKINVLTMGEEEARTMGVNSQKLRWILIVCATLITAAAVSVSGMIGWVGLVIPHFTRMLVGNDYRRVVPVSILLGGAYLVLVDDFARMLTTSEIPLGILTAFVGAPFFLYLIMREGKKI